MVKFFRIHFFGLFIILTGAFAFGGQQSLCKSLNQIPGGGDAIACWDFNSELSEILVDRSGNEHHGALKGAPKWGPGVDSLSLTFDAPDEWIQVLSLGENGNRLNKDSMTFSLWFLSAVNKDQVLLYYLDVNTEYQIRIQSGNIRFSHQSRGGKGGLSHFTTQKIDVIDSKWHHLAIVREKESIAIYLDGVKNPVIRTMEPGDFTSRNAGLFLATSPYSPQQSQLSFEGKMDETLILNKSLTSLSVQWIFQQTVNTPPYFISMPETTAIEKQGYSYRPRAEDDDGDPVQFHLTSGPQGLSFSGNTLVWVPKNSDVGNNPVTLMAKDTKGGFSLQTYSIEVTNVNDKPLIISDPPLLATVGLQYFYQVEVEDPDLEEQIYYQLIQFPAGLTLGDDGKVVWVPSVDQGGTHRVQLIVRDIAAEADTQTFQLNVTTINTPPRITISGLKKASEDIAYFDTLSASDQEEGTLSWKILSGPEGLHLSSQGILTMLPVDSQWGIHIVVIRVFDGVLADTATLELEIVRVNDAPRILSQVPEVQVYEAGIQRKIYLAAYDEEGGPLSWSVLRLPANARVQGDTFSFQPDTTQLGLDSLVFVVSDGEKTDSLSHLYLVVRGSTPVLGRILEERSFTLNQGTNGFYLYISREYPSGWYRVVDLNGRVKIAKTQLKNGWNKISNPKGSGPAQLLQVSSGKGIIFQKILIFRRFVF